MGKSLNSGITWTEVANLLSGLEGIHECNVELTVTTGGQGHNGLLSFTLLAWVPTVEIHQIRELAKVSGTWPNRERPTFDSEIFHAGYELDRAIGKAYAQEKIPEA